MPGLRMPSTSLARSELPESVREHPGMHSCRKSCEPFDRGLASEGVVESVRELLPESSRRCRLRMALECSDIDFCMVVDLRS